MGLLPQPDPEQGGIDQRAYHVAREGTWLLSEPVAVELQAMEGDEAMKAMSWEERVAAINEVLAGQGEVQPWMELQAVTTTLQQDPELLRGSSTRELLGDDVSSVQSGGFEKGIPVLTKVKTMLALDTPQVMHRAQSTVGPQGQVRHLPPQRCVRTAAV